MKKDIRIQFSEEEISSLMKMWEKVKNNSFLTSKAKTIEEFCKEIIITFVKGPDLSALKDLNLSDLMSQIGDLDHLKDIFNSFNKKNNKPDDKKKDIVLDDKKYKS
jgi:hypothetical protein